MDKRIVIVGGGSAAWGPKLMLDLLLTPAISDATYVLHDLNAVNAERIARFARRLAADLKAPARVEVEADPDRALSGADFVIITISTGGLDAMAHDLAIPERYGIYHTVGDTSGPGGWSRTLRNVPVFVDLAKRIDRVAPDAVILNYTNPMAQLTKTLCVTTGRPVIGLCHGVFDDLGFLRKVFDLASEDEIQAAYAGLNHFFWIISLSIRGQDGYTLLRDRLAGRSLPELLAEVEPGRDGFYLADELFRFTGLLTYLPDRHTSEFFPQYITSEKNLAKYHLVRTTVQQRRENMRRAEQQIEQATENGIPERYLKRSRETAADIIDAFVTGRTFVDVGNTPNIGQVSNVPLGSVVETPVLVTQTGFRPITTGPLPEPMRTWVERYARVQDLTVEAALAGDLNRALKALTLDPLVSHLTIGEVEELGLALLRANARLLPQFAGKLG